MLETSTLLKATLDVGLEMLKPPVHHTPAEQAAKAAPVMVPIRSLSSNHRERIAAHLLSLDAHDRYLRFGYAANESHIRQYTDSLNFERDEIYGIYNRRLELIAMAHLAFASDPTCTSCAEFGVSVLKDARGRGYGARLFDRAVMHATNEGVGLMFIHALSENTAMLSIARKAGATVERDGSESEAYLKLPGSTLDTRMSELVETQVAELDYQLKLQAKRFWELVRGFAQARSDAIVARRGFD